MTRSQPMDETLAAPAASLAERALYSRFVQRLHRRYADVLPLLPTGAPTRDSLSAAEITEGTLKLHAKVSGVNYE